MESKRLSLALWTLTAVGMLALAAVNLWLGDLNQDEGWYLYAAGLVADGKTPYADFAFTQGPVMPYVYASLGDGLVKALGVAGGRLLTAILGMLATAAAVLFAVRLVKPGRRSFAAVTTFILIALNVYQGYFMVVVKTYSLCALFLTTGFLCLSLCGRRNGWLPPLLAGVMLALAGGTRISALAALPVVFIVLVAAARSSRGAGAGPGPVVPDDGEMRIGYGDALWFLVGGTAAVFAVFGPFFAACPGNALFGLIEYHSGRDTGGAAKQLIFKAGFISRLVLAYFVPVGIAVVCAVLLSPFRNGQKKAEAAGEGAFAPLPTALWATVLAITLVHFMAPFPYDDYQVAVFPLFAAGTAALAAALAVDKKAQSRLAAIIFVLSVLACGSSPMNQSLFVKERDRIWWRIKEKSPLELLRRAGDVLRELAGPDNLILTQDTYLAVEAGLRVPEGLELGPFSYYPAMDDETARKRHVLNAASMRSLLARCPATVAAFSGYGLAIRCPEVAELPAAEQDELWSEVLKRYRPDYEISHFGQALTTLKVLVRNESETR